MSSEDYRKFWHGSNKTDVFESAERTKRKTASEKEEMSFVDKLRQSGWLDEHNCPLALTRFDTKRNCPFSLECPKETRQHRVVLSCGGVCQTVRNTYNIEQNWDLQSFTMKMLDRDTVGFWFFMYL